MEGKEWPAQKVPVTSYAVDAAREHCYSEDGITLTERKAMENDGTMVTVVCITYKHEEFIAQALDSFLMQKTNFKYKIFVGEDCGPDGTADIIREYAKKYPDILVPFLREQNMGAQRNLIDMCQRATSPYIAFCEGDDYWVDEYKLQKQFDYMEAHPEIRVCCTQTEIVAPQDWHLRSWYKPMPDGKLLLPDSVPGYVRAETFTAAYILGINVAHTSTHFYRWNYDLELPDWYFEGIIGDTPLLLLQMENTEMGHIPEVTSVYRINEGSIFFNKNRELHFLNTRRDMIRYLSGLHDYAKSNLKNYPITDVANRLKLEIANYLKVLISRKDYDRISTFFADFPEAGTIALNTYLEFYWDQRSLTASLGWDGYTFAVRNWRFRKLLKPLVKWALKLKKLYDKFYKAPKNWLTGRVRNLKSFLYYWRYTLTPKESNIWIFSGYNLNNYMDNSAYLYEYALEHHPEIKAFWLTKNTDIYNQLLAENKPVLMWRTEECRNVVSKAEIAVIDHFKMSDTDNLSGFNDRIRVVQLWHGVGLKSMQDVVNATTVDGVRYDRNMVLSSGDKGWTKFKKMLWHFRHAYFSERFEHYFMLVCPGQERVEQIAKTMNIPLNRCFISGHPRNIYLHSAECRPGVHRILYAPTFRWDPKAEEKLCGQIIEAAEMIEAFLAESGYELTVRLHPLTWRNYSKQLEELEENCEHIIIDREKDVYKTLASYDVLITDYSSIAYDFVLLDRPVVFFNFDYKEYQQYDHSLNYNYDEYSPGMKTSTWEETLAAIREYADNPEKDSQWRCRVRDEFYDMSANDEFNSERIIQEIKRRLNEEK